MTAYLNVTADASAVDRTVTPPKAKSKNKGGNVKSSPAVDGLSTEDMSKDQLEDHIIHLQEELAREREEELEREREDMSYFQRERDNIQAFWEISKRNVDEMEAKLRIRSRERDEAAERHRVEIEVCKQKLKHILSEQHNAVTELRIRSRERDEAEERHRVEIEERQAQMKVTERKLRDLTLEHDLLLQDFEKVQQERDELLRKQRDAIMDVQQELDERDELLRKQRDAIMNVQQERDERDELLRKQTDAIMDLQQGVKLHTMMLERKLAERKEAQLCAALSASSADPTAAGSAAGRLKAIMQQMDDAIAALKEELAQQHLMSGSG